MTGEGTRVRKRLVTCLTVVRALAGAGIVRSCHNYHYDDAHWTRVCTVNAERWMKALPHPRYVHMKGLSVSIHTNFPHKKHSPLVRVNTEVTSKVTLASKCPVALRKLANEGADHKVMSGADLVGVVDQLKVESIVVWLMVIVCCRR